MIKWITDVVGTGAFEDVIQIKDDGKYTIVDVRELLDGPGNSNAKIREKIDESIQLIENRNRVVICCDHGISRSNSIACGVISLLDMIPFFEAAHLVIKKTREMQIKPEVLMSVFSTLNRGHKKNSSRKAILVTGATGDVGSALCKSLGEEYKYFPISGGQIDLTSGSILLDLFVKENGIDSVIHLAHPRISNTNKAMGDAIVMLKNVLEVCVTNNCRLIFLSTVDVFGGRKEKKLIVNKKTPSSPKGIFAETKHVIEKLIELTAAKHKLNYAILRIPKVYGRNCKKPKFLLNFIAKVRLSKTVVTHKFSNGYPMIDLIHVDDLVELILQVLKLKIQGIFNIGGGNFKSTLEIAKEVIFSIGSVSDVQSTYLDDKFCSIIINNRGIERNLHWKPGRIFKNEISKI